MKQMIRMIIFHHERPVEAYLMASFVREWSGRNGTVNEGQ
jgi:hypothetical protein